MQHLELPCLNQSRIYRLVSASLGFKSIILKIIISVGNAIKKMTEKVLHQHDSGEINEGEDSSHPISIPASLSGHQDLDNWV